MERIELRFERLGLQLDKLGSRFDRLETRLDRQDEDIAEIIRRLMELGGNGTGDEP